MIATNGDYHVVARLHLGEDGRPRYAEAGLYETTGSAMLAAAALRETLTAEERAHGVTYTVFWPESWREAVAQGSTY